VRANDKNHWLQVKLAYSTQAKADAAALGMRRPGHTLGSLRLQDPADDYDSITLAEGEYLEAGLSSPKNHIQPTRVDTSGNTSRKVDIRLYTTHVHVCGDESCCHTATSAFRDLRTLNRCTVTVRDGSCPMVVLLLKVKTNILSSRHDDANFRYTIDIAGHTASSCRFGLRSNPSQKKQRKRTRDTAAPDVVSPSPSVTSSDGSLSPPKRARTAEAMQCAQQITVNSLPELCTKQISPPPSSPLSSVSSPGSCADTGTTEQPSPPSPPSPLRSASPSPVLTMRRLMCVM